MTSPQRVAVIGAGTMGHSIGILAALGGCTVCLHDVEAERLSAAVRRGRQSADRLVQAGKVSPEAAATALARLTPASELGEAVARADVVVEAVPEVLELKQALFRQIDGLAPSTALLATNTSGLSITAIASATARPESVIGLHFFNPPVVMRLVEVVRGERTSDWTLERALAFVQQLGKESVVCRRDAAGFITTRALNALRLECIRMWEEGIASIEDIDKALRLGLNHPMGQFELTDLNGLDVALRNAQHLSAVYGERFRPPESLVRYVAEGRLGRKSGRGWYDYPPEESPSHLAKERGRS